MMMRGFKKKTIASNIAYKIDTWIKTLPEPLRNEVRENYIVTGGAIASMLTGELPNDYDVYFRSSATATKVANHYLSVLDARKTSQVSKIEAIDNGDCCKIIVKSAGVLNEDVDTNDYQYFESLPPSAVEGYFAKWAFSKGKKQPYKPAYVTSNAISLHDGIQLILRFCGSPEEIHSNFDFVHCTNVYSVKEGLLLNQSALEALMAKELRYIGSFYPICSLFRLRKFIRRGFSITAGEILKIAFDISKLDLTNYSVLEEQLIGVDYAYFAEILEHLNKHNGEIDRTYLFELINRVFECNEDDPDTQ